MNKIIGNIFMIELMIICLTGCCMPHEWEKATCTIPQTCIKCGETKGEALGHTWEEATCTTPKTCSVCGKTEGEALGHIWQGVACIESTTCSRCGKTERAKGHTWIKADCTEPETCSVCGKTAGIALGHVWTDADCTEPITCSRCGETEGTALGHAWSDATCQAPKTCSVCGMTEGTTLDHAWLEATCLNPKTCSVCGTTEGDVRDHIWAEATCQAPATCKTCGLSEGTPLDHQIGEDGICSLCNKQAAIILTVDNVQDYLEWHYTDLTLASAQTVYTGGGIKGGMDLQFTLDNVMEDGKKRLGFNHIKDFYMEFDVVIDYTIAGLEDVHLTLTITQDDLDSIGVADQYGTIKSSNYKTTIYRGLDPDAISVYNTVTGTIVNYHYKSDVKLKSVSGYVIL